MSRAVVCAAALLFGCSQATTPPVSVVAPDAGTIEPPASDSGVVDVGPSRPAITHAFGPLELQPYEDRPGNCVQWTVGNERALYLQAIRMSNLGGFHHSNWFIVAEDDFAGPDGYFDCADRGFDEFRAAARGTVLFAQSTQSYTEEQRLAPGAVVKLPPGAKIMANIHTLNLAPRASTTELWLTLEPLHPSEVTAVVTAVSLQYSDLAIPPLKESRFTTDCDFSVPYRLVARDDVSLKVHYILPHYHYLGNAFSIAVVGGDRDGEELYSIAQFDGEPNGKTFDPPLELPGAEGFRMTCGYNNWRDREVRWGNGEGEMCVALILAETGAVLGGTASFGSRSQGDFNGVEEFRAPCLEAAYPKREDQAMPSTAEKSAPLYLPPVDPNDRGVPAIPACKDADPSATAEAPLTLASIRETIFEPACTFSACHGLSGASGLSLTGTDLHDRLMDHRVRANAGMPLITPGDPSKSWLYQKVSLCTPADASGAPHAHMPLNAPVLLDDELVAKIRDWIVAGAPGDR